MKLRSVVAVGVLAAAARPVVALLASRHLPVVVRARAPLVGLAAIAAGLVTTAAMKAPTSLHVIAALTGVGLGASAWRARPGFGRTRGLPPGSLSLAGSLEAIVDRDYYARQSRRHGPIFKMAQFVRGTVCVVGIERSRALLRAHGGVLGPSALPFTRQLRGGFLRYMNAADHARYGALFRSALSAAAVEAAVPVARQMARHELAAMAEACAGAGGSVRAAEHVERIAVAALVRALFGVEPGDPEFARLASLHGVLQAQPLSRRLSARTRVALDELRTLVVERAARWPLAGADPPGPSSALAALVRPGTPAADPTLVDNLLFIWRTAAADVAALLHWLLNMLGNHPAWCGRVREELGREATCHPSLAQRIVMETVRLEQSEFLYRVIRAPFVHEGVRFPRGWQLRVCIKESHRRPGVFADPDAFDPDRFLDPAFPWSEYAPFGLDHHACLGVELTHEIGQALVEELARGFDARTVQDGPPERDFRHWSHWRPSARFRLSVTRRLETPARHRER